MLGHWHPGKERMTFRGDGKMIDVFIQALPLSEIDAQGERESAWP